MTYTETDARWELKSEYEAALNSTDSEFIKPIAHKLKEAGDDEEAETLMDIAKGLEKGDWAYDVYNER